LFGPLVLHIVFEGPQQERPEPAAHRIGLSQVFPTQQSLEKTLHQIPCGFTIIALLSRKGIKGIPIPFA